jgi:hypothetical protein
MTFISRRKMLLAGASLAAAAACSGPKDPETSKGKPVLSGASPIANNDKGSLTTNLAECGQKSNFDPDDWHTDALSPREYLIEPMGGTAVLGGPPRASQAIVARPSVGMLGSSSSAATRLNDAYAALSEDLPDGKQKIKLSLGLQAMIHRQYCGHSSLGVHNWENGLFFAWHRAYLYFHEKLIQWTLKTRCGVSEVEANMFRLPYWAPGTDFGVYGEPGRMGLFRARGPSNSNAPKLTENDCMQTDLEAFGKRVIAFHGNVHNWLCGDFSNPSSSGFDPLFYAFHAYVDLLWESSGTTGQFNLRYNPSTLKHDPWYGVFFDATKPDVPGINPGQQGWTQVDLIDFNDPTMWGYRYDATPTCDPNTPALEFSDVPMPDSDIQDFRLVVRRRGNLITKFMGDDEKQIAEIHPFGHVPKVYPFVRAQMNVDEARKYADTSSWEFLTRATNYGNQVTAPFQGKPVIVQ